MDWGGLGGGRFRAPRLRDAGNPNRSRICSLKTTRSPSYDPFSYAAPFCDVQNGSILDGLTLWKRNVDKRFEGIEECYICYYVLHGSNYQLPKLTCRTCRKKFHAACLYKWFSTSNNSTCPLCRNLF